MRWQGWGLVLGFAVTVGNAGCGDGAAACDDCAAAAMPSRPAPSAASDAPASDRSRSEDTDPPSPAPTPSESPPEPTVAAPALNPDSAVRAEPMAEPPSVAAPVSSRLRAVPRGESGSELGYWEYLPPGYGEQPVPLLVFTHGAAWQGDGSSAALQRLLEVGPVQLIASDAWPSERPFLVLAPQNPRAGCFDPGDIDAFYRHALETYDVDRARVYHTGQSCGAIGAWGYLAEHTDEVVTAAVLISGDGRAAFDAAGCALGRVAIWGLHNELDGVVPSAGSIEPIEQLLGCEPAPDVRLTVYAGESAHDAWTKTYDLSAGNDVYAWLLGHMHR